MPRRVTLLLAPLLLSGCGLVFTHGPPDGHKHMVDFKCTESNVGPMVDVAVAAVEIVAGFVIGSDPEAYGYPEKAGGNIKATGVVEALFFAVSAAVGFDKVTRCRAAVEELTARMARIRSVAAPPGTPTDYVLVHPATDTIPVGETVQLQALAFGSRRPLMYQPYLAWSSSNDAVAWVTRTGLVTALAPGTALIAATTQDDVIGTATVVVVAPPKSPPP